MKMNMVDARFRVGTARANVHLNVVQNSTGNMRMLDNSVRWFKVSLRTLTTTDSCLTHIFHDCTDVVNHTLPVKRGVKHPTRFTGKRVTRYIKDV